VLVDDGAAAALAEVAGLHPHRLRRTSVKGYSRLQPWSLRRERVRED
jgi:adenylate cyclase